MNPNDLMFYLLAGLALACGFLVVANPFSRSPVASALFLVLTILALAGLFVLLGAYFLAAIQVVVYAGAVMVLFVFVIMLLDLGQEERRRIRRFSWLAGLLAVGGAGGGVLAAVLSSRVAAAESGLEVHAADVGRRLFTSYLLPFELLSVLLLVAMVGAVLLSKKDLK
jgi:NADH-quinone oxidoreductase subunit J